LLNLNAMTVVSSVGIAKLTDKDVIVADYLLPITTGRIPLPVINRLLWTLAECQVQVAAVLNRYKVVPQQILADEYMAALPTDPATGAKTMSVGLGPEEVEAWLARS
jgi:hypothetical protein